MPLYEYQCEVCAHRFEVIQKYSDPHIDVCPKCGGLVKKLLSSPAIQFKGTGWYITDYARAGKSDAGNVSSGKSESGGSADQGSGTRDQGSGAKASATGDKGSSTKEPASGTSDQSAAKKADPKP